MPNIRVIGLGAMNVDRLYRVEDIVVDGEMPVEDYKLLPGGSAANTIYGLAKLGVATGFVGIIGDDEEGKLLLDDFTIAGVETSLIKLKRQAKTGSVLCLSDKRGKRALYISPGANSQLDVTDIAMTSINKAEILHLSSFVDNRQFDIQVDLVSHLAPSVKVSLAPGAPYTRRGLQALVPLLVKAHVLFTNRQEMEQLTGEDFIKGARMCCQQGCHIVVVTLGGGVKLEREKGASIIVCHICTGENEYQLNLVDSVVAPQVDTTGAGDAFAAGFLFGILEEKELPECARLGDLVARFSITGIGARDSLPSLNTLSQKYQKYYQQPL